MKLSLVIPCYNEEQNIAPMHNEVEKVFEGCGFDYEIVFVNDGSKDGTLKQMKEIRERSTLNIKVISFSRNFGKEAAIYAGLTESIGDYVTLIDADLQQDPAIAREMVEILDNNDDLDCVTAFQKVRHEGKVISFLKNGFYRIINKITEVEFKEGASDFRTMRRSMVTAVLSMTEYYRFSKGIFSWVGFNNYFLPYEVKDRAHGSTKWSFGSLFKYAMDGIISFSTAPLRIATVIGVLTAILSVVYMLVVVVQKLVFDIRVPGYATTVVLILFLGGLQLFGMGIIGEYVAKTYVETKKRPIYIAKEIIECKSKDKKEEDLEKENIK